MQYTANTIGVTIYNMKNKTENTEKENFFKNLNDFLIKSGAVAAGIKAVTTNFSAKVEEVKKESERKAIIGGLSFFGAILAFYGAAQLIMFYLDLSMYTNLAVGVIFLLGALCVKAFK